MKFSQLSPEAKERAILDQINKRAKHNRIYTDEAKKAVADSLEYNMIMFKENGEQI